jgi:DNA-binding NarL/FixJ family response regulator
VILVEDDDPHARAAGPHDRGPSAAHAPGERWPHARRGARSSRRFEPDVLITDIGLPDGSGIELIGEARRKHPNVLALVITIFGDESHVVAAIEAGAMGYLLKDGTADYIGSSILEMIGWRLADQPADRALPAAALPRRGAGRTDPRRPVSPRRGSRTGARGAACSS